MTNLSVAEMGRLIRTEREKRKLTQGAVALAVGTTQQTIEKIELGKVERSSYLLPILSFLGIKIDQEHAFGAELHPKAAPSETSAGQRLQHTRQRLGLSSPAAAAILGIPLEDLRKAEQGGTDILAAQFEKDLSNWIESNQEKPFDSPRSLLPTGVCPQPYFITGAKKGLHFQYFVERPRSGPLRGARCSIVVAGDWVRGAPIGTRLDIFDRGDSRNPFPNMPTWVVAIAEATKPEEISEMAVGILLDIREGHYHLTEVWSNKRFQLPQDRWQIAELDQITLNQPPQV